MGRFLLEKIALRIQSDGLEQECFGMVERERRPVCDFLELQNELSKQQTYPKEFHWLFGDSNKSFDVYLFNQEWTKAYLRVVSKRVTDDVFRIVAVRLLQPLVFECIQFTINLFSQGGKVKLEAKKSKKQLNELIECRDALQETYERFGKKGIQK